MFKCESFIKISLTVCFVVLWGPQKMLALGHRIVLIRPWWQTCTKSMIRVKKISYDVSARPTVIGWNRRSLLPATEKQHSSTKVDRSDFNEQIKPSSVFKFAFFIYLINKWMKSGLNHRVCLAGILRSSQNLISWTKADNSPVVKPPCARALLQTLLRITRVIVVEHDIFRCTCSWTVKALKGPPFLYEELVYTLDWSTAA